MPPDVVFEEMPLPHDLGRDDVELLAADPQHGFAVGERAIDSAVQA